MSLGCAWRRACMAQTRRAHSGRRRHHLACAISLGPTTTVSTRLLRSTLECLHCCPVCRPRTTLRLRSRRRRKLPKEWAPPRRNQRLRQRHAERCGASRPIDSSPEALSASRATCSWLWTSRRHGDRPEGARKLWPHRAARLHLESNLLRCRLRLRTLPASRHAAVRACGETRRLGKAPLGMAPGCLV
jgi:hypothetical protein